MAPVIIVSCLAAIVLAGLIAFVYKSFSKSSGDVKKTDGDKVVSNEKEKDQTKDVSHEVSKVANKTISVDEAVQKLMKNVKNSEEKDTLVGFIDSTINANKRVINYFNEFSDTCDRTAKLNNEITDLNKIKQALINYKI